MTFSSEGRIAARPPLFRALGRGEPPPRLTAAGRDYDFVETLKHDSWAASARYKAGPGDEIVCKFGRRQRLLLLPGAWTGRWLARREARVLRACAGHTALPALVEPIVVAGQIRDDAVAHRWIPGRPFTRWTRVDDAFFPTLSETLARLHEAGIAHADMAKWENILVGDDGRPWLLDFQVHLRARGRGPWRWVVRQMQRADRFYLRRHWHRARPDQLALNGGAPVMPVLVRAGEAAGSLWRPLRIAILRLFGVRGDPRRS